MSARLESVILENLLHNEEYARQVLPFLQEDYFHERPDKLIFKQIQSHFDDFNKAPDKDALIIAADDFNINKSEYDHVVEVIESLRDRSDQTDWLLKKTEDFCKDKAVFNAIMKSINIIEGKDKNFSKEALPAILQDALAVSFDKSVGHDFVGDADERYDFYHRKEDRVPFDIALFNKITKGGLPKKTLNVVLAGTNVGKSLLLCHHAASTIKLGKNALYITMEMAEERIAERVDCNLMGVDLDELYRMGKKAFKSKIDEIGAATHGKLVIKEYPTSSAHAGHFRALLDELKLKKDFTPDIIYVDYINICASSRLKAGGNVNSYTLIKSIAEELRALAVEYNVPILSATQTNRSGWQNSEVEMSDTSESAGLPMTVDFLFAMIRTEELDAMGQLLIKQLKSRYNNVNYHRKFVVGIDIDHFKLFDVEESAQVGINDDSPVFDKTPTGKRTGGADFDFD
jgi:replicative DNA helicase